MTEIPDSWPPEDPVGVEKVVPVFPLANVWLFPGIVQPLHVFEERYRQMIEDCLDGPGRIVMGTVVPGHEPELPEAPPIYPIAGLGEIGRHERLDDGRFNVWLAGLCRVRIDEVESDRLYRRVRIQELHESSPDSGTAPALEKALREAIVRRNPVLLNLPEGLSLGYMADLLTFNMELAGPRKQEIFSDLDPASRARKALEEHERQ